MRAITFPKTSEGVWTNSETGARVVRRFTNGLAAYEVRVPALNVVGWSHFSYAQTLTEARRKAVSYAHDVARLAIAEAYAEAVVEDAERHTQASDEYASFTQLRDWVARHNLINGRPEHVNHAIEADHAEALVAHANHYAGQKSASKVAPFCTATTDEAHAFERDMDVAHDKSLVLGVDICGLFEADHDKAPQGDQDHVEAHKEYAARIIEASRAPENATGPGLPEVPADVNDDAAWAAYCAALPQPTDQEIADVLDEYGDPYAALRSDAVQGYKDAARMIWKIRRAQRVASATPDEETLALLRRSMRIYRGVIEVYGELTEAWRIGNRANVNRDAATQTF